MLPPAVGVPTSDTDTLVGVSRLSCGAAARADGGVAGSVADEPVAAAAGPDGGATTGAAEVAGAEVTGADVVLGALDVAGASAMAGEVVVATSIGLEVEPEVDTSAPAPSADA